MINWLDKNQRWIRKGLKQSKNEHFRNYLLKGLPDINQTVQNSHFFVLDFETTGLDVNRDHIISAGFTEIKNNRIQLNKSEHHLVTTKLKLESNNVSIHNLTDDMVSKGMSIIKLFEYLLVKMAGKVLIAHYQKIEYSFIQQACQSLYGLSLPLIMLDTLEIEKRKQEKLNRPIVANQLRLFNLRNAYNLPRYNAHNAMEDAISTAELFIAQVKIRNIENNQTLIKDLI
jgi:DNA polymerase-3 subunit epsilon